MFNKKVSDRNSYRYLRATFSVLSLILITGSNLAAHADAAQDQAYVAARQLETQSKSSDSPFAWQQAGEAWIKHYPNMTQSPQEKVLAYRRSLACYIRAYEAAGRAGNQGLQTNMLGAVSGAYSRMESVEPSNPAWHYFSGVCHTFVGDYREARQKLSEAVKMAPNSDVAKKATALAMHNLPAVRQEQYEDDQFSNSAAGRLDKDLDKMVRESGPEYYGKPGPGNYRPDKYTQWKQYNGVHSNQMSFDEYKSSH